jgi:hypothetical protein
MPDRPVGISINTMMLISGFVVDPAQADVKNGAVHTAVLCKNVQRDCFVVTPANEKCARGLCDEGHPPEIVPTGRSGQFLSPFAHAQSHAARGNLLMNASDAEKAC